MTNKIMHTFGQVNAPKSNMLPVHSISGFTTTTLKKHLNKNRILEMDGNYYRYKGAETVTFGTVSGDFIRVKENNDVVADLLIH